MCRIAMHTFSCARPAKACMPVTFLLNAQSIVDQSVSLLLHQFMLLGKPCWHVVVMTCCIHAASMLWQQHRPGNTDQCHFMLLTLMYTLPPFLQAYVKGILWTQLHLWQCVVCTCVEGAAARTADLRTPGSAARSKQGSCMVIDADAFSAACYTCNTMISQGCFW